MPFAIVGYFDVDSDVRIKSIWRDFAELSIDDYMHNSANSPHFKLSMYSDLDVKSASGHIYDIASRYGCIDLLFKNFIFYFSNNNPVICINIASSVDLLDFQAEVRKKIDSSGECLPVDYFDKGKWQPDCPLTTSSFPMKKEKLAKAADYLSALELPFYGKLKEIGIIEFHPARKILTHPLI